MVAIEDAEAERAARLGDERLEAIHVELGVADPSLEARQVPLRGPPAVVAPAVREPRAEVARPAAEGDKSGGDRTLVPALARAAAAVGVDGFFFEVHPEPERALCDGPNCLRLAQARDIFAGLAELDDLLRRSNFPAVD